MTRNPPEIKEILRKENGFVCAHPECFSPYLEYHHFDPTWAELNHNDPKGIIGLCSTHHPFADGGSYSKQTLHQWKKDALMKFITLKSKIEWRRENIIFKDEKNNIIYDFKIALIIRDRPVIWFNTDPDGYRLLNIDFRDKNENQILLMIDNVWEVKVDVEDLECPPQGKSISIKFKNGDSFYLSFSEIETIEAFYKITGQTPRPSLNKLPFPLSCFEIVVNLKNYGINLFPNGITNCFFGSNENVLRYG